MVNTATCRACGHVSAYPGFHMTGGLCNRCYARDLRARLHHKQKVWRPVERPSRPGPLRCEIVLGRVSAKGASRGARRSKPAVLAVADLASIAEAAGFGLWAVGEDVPQLWQLGVAVFSMSLAMV